MTANAISIEDLNKKNLVFGHCSFSGHEQIVFCSDQETGLKAIIGIHNTSLGPALGGVRMWRYKDENQALNDVLRLSRGMTFKSAVTGLKLGGGKAVIIGDAKLDKNDRLIRRFGQFIHSLGGKYITAGDVGMQTRDIDLIQKVTPYVTGVSKSRGGAGNPSPVTAYGVYVGMKAAVKYKFGSDKLEGKRVLVQGTGNVGASLIYHLKNEGAHVIINDIDKNRIDELSKKYGVKICSESDIYGLDVDIYSPCALGATINDNTVYDIKAKIIAGAANNQLEDEVKHGKILKDRGITYVPDFVINAGGIINVYAEIAKYDRDEIIRKTENIYNTVLNIFEISDSEDITAQDAAMSIAKLNIDRAKKNDKPS